MPSTASGRVENSREHGIPMTFAKSCPFGKPDLLCLSPPPGISFATQLHYLDFFLGSDGTIRNVTDNGHHNTTAFDWHLTGESNILILINILIYNCNVLFKV